MAPTNLVSVNTAPERAKVVIGTVIENVKDKYDIVHAGNSTTIEGVRPLLESVQPPPGILFCASMVSHHCLGRVIDGSLTFSGHQSSRRRSNASRVKPCRGSRHTRSRPACRSRSVPME